jgi:hypothetical protein
VETRTQAYSRCEIVKVPNDSGLGSGTRHAQVSTLSIVKSDPIALSSIVWRRCFGALGNGRTARIAGQRRVFPCTLKKAADNWSGQLLL